MTHSRAAQRNKQTLANNEDRLASTLHDLKNPLAGVRGAIQVVCSRMPRNADHDLLTAAIARLDEVNEQLSRLARDESALRADGPVPRKSGVHVIDREALGLPPKRTRDR